MTSTASKVSALLALSSIPTTAVQADPLSALTVPLVTFQQSTSRKVLTLHQERLPYHNGTIEISIPDGSKLLPNTKEDTELARQWIQPHREYKIGVFALPYPKTDDGKVITPEQMANSVHWSFIEGEKPGYLMSRMHGNGLDTSPSELKQKSIQGVFFSMYLDSEPRRLIIPGLNDDNKGGQQQKDNLSGQFGELNKSQLGNKPPHSVSSLTHHVTPTQGETHWYIGGLLDVKDPQNQRTLIFVLASVDITPTPETDSKGNEIRAKLRVKFLESYFRNAVSSMKLEGFKG